MTVGSISSLVVGPGGSAASYKAAKGGVLQLTKAIAVDYAAEGIRANCLCPGAVSTDLAKHVGELTSQLTTEEPSPPTKIRISAPMARSSDPSEMASIIAFLVSDDASFVTGTAMVADGGLTAI